MPTTSTPRPRGRPGGGRERILDVACDLISSQGMDDVRVARIAQAANVSTALVHYHFATREALLGEALRHAYARAGTARTALRDGVGDVVRAPARAHDRALPAARRARWSASGCCGSSCGCARSAIPACRTSRTSCTCGCTSGSPPCSRRASPRGEFAIADVDATTDVLLGAIDGVGVRVLAGDPALDLDRAWALLLGLASREVGAAVA